MNRPGNRPPADQPTTAQANTPNAQRPRLVRLLVDVEHRHERRLGHLHLANGLHPLLALRLLVQELLLAADVTAAVVVKGGVEGWKVMGVSLCVFVWGRGAGVGRSLGGG